MDTGCPASIAVSAWQAWLWLKQDDLASAVQWAQEIEPTTYGDLTTTLVFEHMTLAHVQMAQGRLDDAQALLARLLKASRDAGSMGGVIAIAVLQALAFRAQGNTNEAMKSLEYALSLAELEGYLRTFIDEGAPMADLLRQALSRGIAADYVTRLLAAVNDEMPAEIALPIRRRIGDDVEKLSERELEVLRLIADGASNRESRSSSWSALAR